MIRKKGSLSIGVNAIVTLIIAVVALGLILGFINKTFKKVSDIPLPEAQAPTPTASEPLTISSTRITTQPGKVFALSVGVFNKEDNTAQFSFQNPIDCVGDSGTAQFEVISNSKSIGAGNSAFFQVGIKVPNNIGGGAYVCTLIVKKGSDEYASQDLFITIE